MYMYYGLNSFKGVIGDYLGDYHGGHLGEY